MLGFLRPEQDGFLPMSPRMRGRAASGPGIPTGRGHLSFTLSRYDIPRMSSDYDPRRQAEAAIKEAVLADGFERQRWILLAQAWLELARTRPDAHGSERSS